MTHPSEESFAGVGGGSVEDRYRRAQAFEKSIHNDIGAAFRRLDTIAQMHYDMIKARAIASAVFLVLMGIWAVYWFLVD